MKGKTMAKHDRTYVRIRGAWHLAETGYQLEQLRRPAVKLACTGGLAARGFPERSSKPREQFCERCQNPPDAGMISSARAALATRSAGRSSTRGIGNVPPQIASALSRLTRGSTKNGRRGRR